MQSKRQSQNTRQTIAKIPPAVSVLQKTNTFLSFWAHCGNRACRRTRGCAGDATACFDRFWPHVPGEIKIRLRTAIGGKAAGLSADEIEAECRRALAHYLGAGKEAATPISPAKAAGRAGRSRGN